MSARRTPRRWSARPTPVNTEPQQRRYGAVVEVEAYLGVLFGRETGRALIELRWRHGQGMRHAFIEHTRTLAATRTILQLGRRTDVYVGVAPRTRPHGGKDAIDRVWTLWADLDNPAARDTLDQLPVKPAILVASGTPGHAHAYFPLTTPVTATAAEIANRRLASQLGADSGSVTNAATILRPPATFSHKTTPPARVVLERLEPRLASIDAITEGIAADPAATELKPSVHGRRGRAPEGEDPLRALDPALYFEVLTGESVGRSRKISCPWHEDRTPSLHVYKEPAGGWYCYGCTRHGHSVYDLASQLWGLDTHGTQFLELRRRLYDLFLPERTPPGVGNDPPHREGRRRPQTRLAPDIDGPGHDIPDL